jgi:hypothetical protein
MAERIDELLVGLGLDTDEQSFQQGMSAFNGIRSAALSAAGAIGVSFGAREVVEFASRLHSASVEAERLQTSVGYLTQLDDAFRQAGASGADATAELGNMARLLDEFRFNTGGAAFNLAAQVGLDPSSIADADNVMQAYETLIDRASSLGAQERRVALGSLGFGIGTEALSQQGPEFMREQMAASARLAGVTDEMVEQSVEFNRELGQLSIGIRGLTDAIMLNLQPTLLAILRPINDWLGTEGSQESLSELITSGPFRYLWENYGPGEGGALREWFENRDTPMTRDQRQRGDQDERSNIDTLLDAIREQESGGRHFDEQGNLLRSPAGALGAYQIMPDTARDPGFGVDPLTSWDEESQREFAGDYISALLDHFNGNLDAALAAYNAGAGRVQSLMEQHGPDWRDYLPSETRAYIPGVRNRMDPMEGGRPQASNVTFNINGATDPQEVARVVDQRLRNVSMRTAEDYRSSLV